MQAHSKAVILARVSTKAQEDGYSLDSQLKLIRDYCKKKSLVVVKEFRIAETASKDIRRKVFRELLVYIIKHRIHHFVVEKTDRLTRNFKDAVSVDEWLEGNDKRVLHLVKENLELHKNSRSDAKLMLNIYLAFAKKYIDNLREEVMKGWAEKLAQGWLPAPPPPGYMTVVEGHRKIHVPNPETVKPTQRAFRLYATPDHTIDTIRDELTTMGVLTSKGRPLTRSYVAKMLRNPFYIGINRFDGKDYPGAQEPIISKALFRAVQKKLDGRSFRASRNKHDPVFKGMIRCSVCGTAITWSKHKGRYYGRCQRKNPVCKGKKMLREDRVERQVIEQLEALDDPAGKTLKKAKAALSVVQEQNVGYFREKTIESLQKQITRINQMEAALYEDKLAGLISQDQYEAKRQQFIEQVASINERLARLSEAQDRAEIVASSIIESAGPLVALYIVSNPTKKRLILARLFKSITSSGGHINIK